MDKMYEVAMRIYGHDDNVVRMEHLFSYQGDEVFTPCYKEFMMTGYPSYILVDKDYNGRMATIEESQKLREIDFAMCGDDD